ncbi:MAG TPA: DNA recombination protein RmuC [Edaphocola sp.]|nr:DNA recombination protein RmuC [Edaphocola sp.]
MTSFYLLIIIITAFFAALLTWLLSALKNRTRQSVYQEKLGKAEKETGILRSTIEMLRQEQAGHQRQQQEDIAQLQEKLDQNEQQRLNMEKENARLLADQRNLSERLQQELTQSKALMAGLEQQKALQQGTDQEKHSLHIKNQLLEEKLAQQKAEVTALQKQFQNQFENLANRIFEQKSESFKTLNKESLKPLLEPLNKNLSEFRSRIEEVYIKEAKERFSLAEKVKELAELNKTISAEAHNLTAALKGETKTQGRWGEMILESILEKSGLTKGREYFMEYQLEDEAGKALRSTCSGKKMRPDALVKCPGNRSVIIDAKVSLNAYSRYVAATDEATRRQELSRHIAAIRNHIIALSQKGYDDYVFSLDFVMMFLPGEAAYLAAVQADPDLWNFAYDKRVLLLSPSNLITALRLVSDLWKREYQNQNTQQIAELGGRIFDKIAGFMEGFESVGDYLDKAQERFTKARKQLHSGKDNLLRQAEKLKELGVKTKKELKSRQQEE